MNIMRHPFLFALHCALPLLFLASVVHAEDGKTKPISDKNKDALEKLMTEAKKNLGKIQDIGDKGNPLWSRSKETLAQTKSEYLKRADSAMKMMDAEIKALAESEGAVITREYFKTHLESLRLHLAYCRQDGEKLKSAESEEAFRVKQKKFDRSLGFLADNIQLAKEEAGL